MRPLKDARLEALCHTVAVLPTHQVVVSMLRLEHARDFLQAVQVGLL